MFRIDLLYFRYFGNCKCYVVCIAALSDFKLLDFFSIWQYLENELDPRSAVSVAYFMLDYFLFKIASSNGLAASIPEINEIME